MPRTWAGVPPPQSRHPTTHTSSKETTAWGMPAGPGADRHVPAEDNGQEWTFSCPRQSWATTAKGEQGRSEFGAEAVRGGVLPAEGPVVGPGAWRRGGLGPQEESRGATEKWGSPASSRAQRWLSCPRNGPRSCPAPPWGLGPDVALLGVPTLDPSRPLHMARHGGEERLAVFDPFCPPSPIGKGSP